jgi:hypothetical protein
MLVLPQVLVVLALLGVAFAMAALPFFRRPCQTRRTPFPRLVPHPSQPGSMLSFTALSAFLLLLTLARFGIFVAFADPLNGPESSSRLFGAPRGVEVEIPEQTPDETRRFSYPHNTADLTVDAARRAESTSDQDRLRGVRDLAWWTGVCPNYAPFTLARLRRALRDPNPRIKGAAAVGLGSTGGHAAAVIPDLLAARGTSVRYFDHLVAEAVYSIERGPRWPPAPECEDVPAAELDRRAVHAPGPAADRESGRSATRTPAAQ